MHLGNGAITPECVALTYTAAAAGLAAGAAEMRRVGFTREKLALAAGLGCLVFAAQSVNVPILPGTSGHLVGGVLLACLVGPGLGAWTMAVVLAAQAIMLGDGGMAALGANVLNMGLVPAAVVMAAQRFASRSSESRSSLFTIGIAAALAVPLAAELIVVESAAFRPAVELTGWSQFAALMLGTHLWIGALEGVATSLLVALLMPVTVQAELRPRWRAALVGVGVALIAAVLFLPISSALPDGYEVAAEASGMGWLLRP